MPDGEKQIFRSKSLERLSTPDRLDQLLRVVKRRNWIPLAGAAVILVFGLAWCFLGRIPITAEATAVLVRPRQVVPLQASAVGELLTLDIHVGDAVAKGDVIATLDVPAVAGQIEAQEAHLEAFLARSKRLAGFNREHGEKEQSHLEGQRTRIAARIETLRALAARIQGGEAGSSKQIDSLKKAASKADELGTLLQSRLEAQKKLHASGRVTEQDVLDLQERLVANRLRRAEIDVQIGELELRAAQAQEQHGARMEHIEGLRAELGRIRLQELEAEQRLGEARVHDETSAHEIRRTLERLRATLALQSRVVAGRAGTVLEVTLSPGSAVTPGQRIATLAVDDPGEPLVALAYFDIASGKKIQSGMRARIAPVTVQKERFGSLRATVERVSTYPVTTAAVVNQVGNREMAQMLVGNRSRIEVRAALTLDPHSASGFGWTSASGPDTRITAGTSARMTVTIEERAPITLLIPALRGWLGLN